ncbi:MAG: hypothetical protein K2Y56_08500 [Methylobacterium sp.]|uniref:hypothetical protein n=1 Tax=Methylobacterium sp. TaxID=409 RepID=UPI0025D3ABB7|nr:hypothetical protein [Methylobacterium sp.]MBX9931566.1 hypothetical protein [Methylobacterium sp.]
MSDSVADLARSVVSSQASSLRGSFQTAALRQQADSEKAVAQLVQQGVETQRAAAPEGQGKLLDIFA